MGGRDVPIEADDPDRRPKLTITRSIPRGHDPGHPEAPPAPVRAVVPGPAWRGASPRQRRRPGRDSAGASRARRVRRRDRNPGGHGSAARGGPATDAGGTPPGHGRRCPRRPPAAAPKPVKVTISSPRGSQFVARPLNARRAPGGHPGPWRSPAAGAVLLRKSFAGARICGGKHTAGDNGIIARPAPWAGNGLPHRRARPHTGAPPFPRPPRIPFPPRRGVGPPRHPSAHPR